MDRCRSETSYWVGKDSLRSWKRLVLERLNQASSSAVGSSVTGKNCSGEDHETDSPNDPDVSMEVATKSEEPSDDVKVRCGKLIRSIKGRHVNRFFFMPGTTCRS